jgi:hypothetical protein
MQIPWIAQVHKEMLSNHSAVIYARWTQKLPPEKQKYDLSESESMECLKGLRLHSIRRIFWQGGLVLRENKATATWPAAVRWPTCLSLLSWRTPPRVPACNLAEDPKHLRGKTIIDAIKDSPGAKTVDSSITQPY